MSSVREALERISELESRKAILGVLAAYLETHFTSSDAGEPDQRITRDDRGMVPESHVHNHIALLDHEIRQLEHELAEWMELSIGPLAEQESPRKAKRQQKEE